MREEGADVGFPEVPRVLLVVEEDELATPTYVGTFCAWAVSAANDFVGELLQ
jgi:hypothetical protein